MHPLLICASSIIVSAALGFAVKDSEKIQLRFAVRIPPSITEEADSHIIYRTNSDIVLPCMASGTPDPEYEWMKNGQPVDLNNNVQMSPTSGTLTISHITSLDEGYYQCIASNDHGKALSSVTYLQRAVLSVDTDTSHLVYVPQLGDYLTLLCNPTRSVPRSIFSWYVAEDEADESPLRLRRSRRVTTDEHGNLHFAHVTEEDDGHLYKCGVFNPYLRQTAFGSYSTVNVQQGTAMESSPTVLYSTPSPRVALVGQDEVRLMCFFAGRPTPRVSFERANGSLPVGRTIRANYDTELVITNVQEDDEGEYICRGRNSWGQSQDVRIMLDVQSAPHFNPGWKPVDYSATEGMSHTFNCKADAEPKAQIQWLINGEPIDHNNPGPRMSVSDDEYSFTISDVSGQSDLMVVSCNATNVHGYAYASGYLNVIM